jgi:hypothetical protein
MGRNHRGRAEVEAAHLSAALARLVDLDGVGGRAQAIGPLPWAGRKLALHGSGVDVGQRRGLVAVCPRLGGRQAGLGVVQAAALEKQKGAPVDLGRQLGDLGRGRGADSVKLESASGVSGKGSVESQAMQVNVDPRRRVCPLDDGDRPRAGLALAAAACLSGDVPEKDSLEHPHDCPSELMVPGEPKAELEGQAQDPVSDGDEGKHPVHQIVTARGL